MRFAAIFLLFLYLLPCPALAMEAELGIEELEKALPPEGREIYGSLEADASAWDEGLTKLMDWLAENSLPAFRSAVKSGGKMLTVLVLCAAAGAVSGGKGPDFVNLGGALGISALAVGEMDAFIGLGENTLRAMTDFCTMLLPCMAAAGAAAGNISSSAAMYGATVLFMDILLQLALGFVMPLIHIYIAASAARAALGSGVIDGAVGIAKWLCVMSMTVLITAFTAYFSITGVVGSAADAAAARVTRTAIAAALPVVGKLVSSAAGTVVAAASMLRAGAGVFGLLSVLAMCAYPFLALGTHYLVYKAVAMLGSGLADNRLSGLIGGIGTAFGLVLSLVGCGVMMLFLSLVSAMKAVSYL